MIYYMEQKALIEGEVPHTRCAVCKCFRQNKLYLNTTGRRLRTCLRCRSKFKCNYCKYRSGTKHLLKVHMETQHYYISCKDCILQKINNTLTICRENDINPSKYFNYAYFAKNSTALNIDELNNFYKLLLEVVKNVEKKNLNIEDKPFTIESLKLRPLFD